MLGNPLIATLLRFVVLASLQVLVFSNIGEGAAWGRYFQLLIYPLVIMLLPVGWHSVLVLLIAFALGISIDIPLGSYGVHAAALVLTAFSRSLILALFEPREGYAVDQSPTRHAFGIRWFAGYVASMMAVHCLAYFAIETFTLVYFVEIILRALGSFCVSMGLIMLYVIVFDPRA